MAALFLRWLGGWVEVRAGADEAAELVNWAVAHGVRVWRVRHRGSHWTFLVGASGWPALLAWAGERGIAAAPLGRFGLPFTIARLLRHRLAAAGALALLAAAWFMSAFVWTVEVAGASEVPPEAVRAAARELGLAPGTFRPALDRDRVARLLPVLLPRVGWATVSIRGTRAVIQVAEEKDVPPPLLPADRPADVVAKKDGLVTDVFVMSGEAAVRPGDTVSKGQVLIRGDVTAVPRGYDPADPAAPRSSVLVRARGEVRALVWYHRYLEVPAARGDGTPTGREYVRWQVALFGRTFTLWGWREPPFASYVARRTVWSPVAGGGPLQIIRRDFREVRRKDVRIAPSEAVAEAKRRALADISDHLPPDARIRGETAELVLKTPSLYGIVVQVEAEEQIGATRERDDGSR